MTSFRNAVHWVNKHQEATLDLIRMYLGIGLFVRGVLFITESNGVNTLVDSSEPFLLSAAVVHYVSFVHLLGGLLLTVGLLTRLSALLQVPILLGAVFLVHWQEGLLSANQSMEFSALVLFLLLLVLVFGPGKWSADYYVFTHEPQQRKERDLEAWWRTEDEEVPAPTPAVDSSGSISTTKRTNIWGGRSHTTEAVPCPCGYDLDHPRVIVEPHYGWSAGFFFLLGISAPVKEVMFYCQDCGSILQRTRDPELCKKYQWHTS